MNHRESYKSIQKDIDNAIEAIADWISQLGKDPTKAIEFIKKYNHHLNDKTKKSMFEHITDITDTKLLEVNKLSDLTLLIEKLITIKKSINQI